MITTATIVKNEASKFLEEALSVWGEFSSRILLLDNGSTDNTKEIAREAGAEVVEAPGKMWGNEAPFRKRLFEEARAVTPEGEWIFVLDADMVPAKDPTPLFQQGSDAIAYPLYDVWGSTDTGHLTYREDNYWRGHLYPRIWAVRNVPKLFLNTNWSSRGIHSNHFPIDILHKNIIFAPKDYALLHFAYSSPELREEKYSQYLSVSSHLNAFERAHAETITDPHPTTKRLPFSNDYYLTPP